MTLEEKEFMKLWNRHIYTYRYGSATVGGLRGYRDRVVDEEMWSTVQGVL